LSESTLGHRFKNDADAVDDETLLTPSSQIVAFADEPDRNFRNSDDFQPLSSVGVRFLQDEANVRTPKLQKTTEVQSQKLSFS